MKRRNGEETIQYMYKINAQWHNEKKSNFFKYVERVWNKEKQNKMY